MGLEGAGISDTSDYRLYFAVVEGGDVGNNVICGLNSSILYAASRMSYWDSLNLVAANTTTSGYEDTTEANIPSGYLAGKGNRHVVVFRTAVNGANAEVDTFYGGVELPRRVSTTLDGTLNVQTVCCNPFAGTPSNGAVFEFGVSGRSTTPYTDTEVHNMIRHLCEKYDVPYMSDTTPLDIAYHNNTTAFNYDMDMPCWYRSDTRFNEDYWGLHPAVIGGPGNASTYDQPMTSAAGRGPLVIDTANSRKRASNPSATVDGGLVTPAVYNWNESTIFPAATGMSLFSIAELNDAATPVSSGYACDILGIQLRRRAAFDQWQVRVAGKAMDTVNTYENKTCFVAGTYDFTETTARGYVDDDTNSESLSDATATVTSYSNVDFAALTSVSAQQLQDARTYEFGAYKHKLSDRELDNLRRYANYRYNIGITI
jgi:hypothetical protein